MPFTLSDTFQHHRLVVSSIVLLLALILTVLTIVAVTDGTGGFSTIADSSQVTPGGAGTAKAG